jgi:hypothetical protein
MVDEFGVLWPTGVAMIVSITGVIIGAMTMTAAHHEHHHHRARQND